MEPLSFHKYEGLGNDFLVVRTDDEAAFTPERVRALCDRRFGVGGDGVLLVLPPRSEGAVARMKVLNADGSVPEMCGNGLRCVAVAVAVERGVERGELAIDTDAGLRRCVVERGCSGAVVEVDMGIVRVTGELSLEADGEQWPIVTADAGNPHAIVRRTVDPSRYEAVGRALSTHAHFPRGTNVHFVRHGEGALDLVVFERGVGLTLACGTGACATVAVACAHGERRVGETVTVRLPGGELAITLGEDGRARMRGPARRVFEGVVADEPAARARASGALG